MQITLYQQVQGYKEISPLRKKHNKVENTISLNDGVLLVIQDKEGGGVTRTTSNCR